MAVVNPCIYNNNNACYASCYSILNTALDINTNVNVVHLVNINVRYKICNPVSCKT